MIPSCSKTVACRKGWVACKVLNRWFGILTTELMKDFFDVGTTLLGKPYADATLSFCSCKAIMARMYFFKIDIVDMQITWIIRNNCHSLFFWLCKCFDVFVFIKWYVLFYNEKEYLQQYL